MRQILVDHARRKRACKRGGGNTVMTIQDASPLAQPRIDVLVLDEALTELTAFDPRLCRVVELKFFAGLNIAETAVPLA